jgi:folate-dependent tRNA-U54 methylase TrmFO/GidA
VTGVEGYVESAAIGLLAGRMAAARSRRTQRPWLSSQQVVQPATA